VDEVERGRLVAWLVAEFEVQNGIDVTGDESALARLREVSARAAAASDTYEVNVPFLAADATGPKHLHVVLAKTRLDAIRAGREGPPHVDRGRRSVPSPAPEPPHEDIQIREGPESSTRLVLMLAILLFGVVFALAYFGSKHSHDEKGGHGQEHKR
jgi:hypothetical protein